VAFEPFDPDDEDGGDAGDCSWEELPEPLLLLGPLPFELLPFEVLPFEVLPPELLPLELPLDPLTVPLEPEELLDPVEPPEPVCWLVPVRLALCADPGSVLATATVPTTLTAPTPTVSADSRAMPRFRSAAADLGGRAW
jgi:hypothetical protein